MNNLVELKYLGGRSFTKVMFNRKSYIFKKENDFIASCPQDVVNWLSQNAPGQYQVLPTKIEIKEVIKEVEKPKDLKCDKCDFIAKSEQGLLIHKSKHKKGGK